VCVWVIVFVCLCVRACVFFCVLRVHECVSCMCGWMVDVEGGR